MKINRRQFLKALPAAALALTACGSGQQEAPATTDALVLDHAYPLDYARQFTADVYTDGSVLLTIAESGDKFLVRPEGAAAYFTDLPAEAMVAAAQAAGCPVPLALDGPGREPLKLTLDAAALGMTGTALADALRGGQLECEYADPRYVVLMFTPCNPPQDYARLRTVLRQCLHSLPAAGGLLQPEELAGEFMALAQQARTYCTIRQAVFAPQERIPVQQALGRICAMPTVSCPPAIPIAVSGEEITPAALELMQRYGVTEVSVLQN